MRIRENLVGQRFGRLIVLSYDGKDKHGNSMYNCECDCGNHTVVRGYSLKRGNVSSCGCLRSETSRKLGSSTRLDLVGKRFGNLTVIDFIGIDENGNSEWTCECDCGKQIITKGSYLTRGSKTSCGCTLRENLVGQRFGRLTVLKYIDDGKRSGSRWLCVCDCGNETIVYGSHLKSGVTASCGCLRKELSKEFHTKHGLSKHPLNNIWTRMHQRCKNENYEHYNRYGGRGISICEEWYDFETFYDWAINNGYEPGLTIDRIDNDGDYKPSNCRWVDRITQANNKSNNRYFTYNGETHTAAEWSRILNMPHYTVLRRINSGNMCDFERYFNNYGG